MIRIMIYLIRKNINQVSYEDNDKSNQIKINKLGKQYNFQNFGMRVMIYLIRNFFY